MSDLLTPEEALTSLDIRMQPVIKRGPGRPSKAQNPEKYPSGISEISQWDIGEYNSDISDNFETPVKSIKPAFIVWAALQLRKVVKQDAQIMPYTVVAKAYGLSKREVSEIANSPA